MTPGGGSCWLNPCSIRWRQLSWLPMAVPGSGSTRLSTAMPFPRLLQCLPADLHGKGRKSEPKRAQQKYQDQTDQDHSIPPFLQTSGPPDTVVPCLHTEKQACTMCTGLPGFILTLSCLPGLQFPSYACQSCLKSRMHCNIWSRIAQSKPSSCSANATPALNRFSAGISISYLHGCTRSSCAGSRPEAPCSVSGSSSLLPCHRAFHSLPRQGSSHRRPPSVRHIPGPADAPWS